MPGRYVFPGGAVDAADANVALAEGLDPLSMSRLSGGLHAPNAYPVAAIRELWEETGLAYAAAAPFDPPAGLEAFAHAGLAPTAAGMTLIFRAITPPGRPRRVDARFFIADATGIHGKLDDFSRASGELSDLGWVDVKDLDAYLLAPITREVLKTALQRLPDLSPPDRLEFRPDGVLGDEPQDPS